MFLRSAGQPGLIHIALALKPAAFGRISVAIGKHFFMIWNNVSRCFTASYHNRWFLLRLYLATRWTQAHCNRPIKTVINTKPVEEKTREKWVSEYRWKLQCKYTSKWQDFRRNFISIAFVRKYLQRQQDLQRGSTSSSDLWFYRE